MKYMMPFALALALGACAHECNCAAVEDPIVEVTETVEAEEIVEIEAEIEEPVVEIATVAEPAEVIQRAETIVIETEGSTTRRVVTRRLVDEIEAGTPTAPALDGSAATDPLLSETPRVLEDETFTTTSTETVFDEIVDDVAEIIEGE